MRLNACLAVLLAAAACAAAQPVAAADLRVSGAATVARGIILPKTQAAIEQETGLTLVETGHSGDGQWIEGSERGGL